MKKISTIFRNVCIAVTGFILSSMPAFAGLPKLEEPSAGAGQGFWGQFKGYIADGIQYAGWGLAAFALFKVGNALLEDYSEVQTGKKKLGNLGSTALIGVLLIVVIIWLSNEASKIFA